MPSAKDVGRAYARDVFMQLMQTRPSPRPVELL